MSAKKPLIAVVGAGLMGHGIAQVFSAAGHDVHLYDPDAAARAAAPERIAAIFDLLGQDKAASGAVTLFGDLAEAAAEAEFVFEAAPEKLELKRDIFATLDNATRGGAVLATNTSCIPIGDIAARVRKPDRVVGTHYWNPPYLVPLVEVVQAVETSGDTVSRMMTLLTGAGKSPVHVKRDIPGFIGNRLQHALKREAIALVADGVCDAETIDTVVKLGFGPRLAVLGPMEQSDLVGLNLTLDIHDVLIEHLDVTPGPHPYLKKLVADGHLGMKTGRGFREWTAESAAAVRKRLDQFMAAALKERQGRD